MLALQVAGITALSGFLLSKKEIDKTLGTLGYSTLDNLNASRCPNDYNGMHLLSANDNSYDYCVYVDRVVTPKDEYYLFGVLTYINLDLPVINNLKLRVFSKSNRMYKFTRDQI